MTITDLALDRDPQNAEHHERLAHHFESMPQQFEAAKLGMWLFLATEVLLFGGLFCLYTVFRGNNPELFAWGSQFLDVNYGALNTVVLIMSSLTMALAVTWTQMGKRWPVIIALSITFICGVVFMAIKSVEYEHKFHENLVWGTKFYEIPPGYEAGAAGAGATLLPGNPATGIKSWNKTCRSCHGIAGEGVTGQGRDIRSSEYIQARTDLELIAFVKVGRLPNDPLNTTGILMPPKGGNPMFKDQDLMHIISYIRSFQVPIETGMADDAETDGEAEADTPVVEETPDPVAIETPPPLPADPATDGVFFIPESSIPLALHGPSGFKADVLQAIELDTLDSLGPIPEKVHHSLDPERPANAHLFFGIYFMLTGLHGLHVIIGLCVIAWLLHRTIMGDFGKNYYTPIDIGGLYWHIVDIIWIFLFPLLYLIA